MVSRALWDKVPNILVVMETCLNEKFNFSNAVKKYIPKAEVFTLYKREFAHLPLCFDREKLQMSLDRSLYQYTQY